MTKSTITREQLEEWVAQFDEDGGCDATDSQLEALIRQSLAAMDSESGCLPLDYLQGHKDGLEWAAQLAEANHPETGDWLYDDPIDLAKAIRKGTEMPPAQSVDSEPVAWMSKGGTVLNGMRQSAHDFAHYNIPLYRHAQPAPVVPVLPEIDRKAIADKVYGMCCRIPGATFYNAAEFAIDEVEACRAAMLQAEPVTTANKLGNSLATPDGYVMVPIEPTMSQELAGYKTLNDTGRMSRLMKTRLSNIYRAMLAAAPQEVKGE